MGHFSKSNFNLVNFVRIFKLKKFLYPDMNIGRMKNTHQKNMRIETHASCRKHKESFQTIVIKI